ncbi:hypothetical protein BJY01DRAFT_246507 [Aspergillus pseudoustus]|uniref:Cytochrome P450 n=1 Tax=Aspergillus pseudoustus TaxID=1810923 RepID=A0ABR4K7A6_9EURO
MEALRLSGLSPVVQDVCFWTAIIFVLASVLYFYLLPKSIKGIPHNAAAIRLLLGDIPALEREAGDNSLGWMDQQARKFSRPICQLFILPFGKPIVYVSDFYEAQDILLRRKEFDRSDYSIALLKPRAEHHYVILKTGQEWKRQRRLLQDLMTPKFLHDVAARNIYTSRIESFAADKDIYFTALDAVLDFIFGENYPDRALPPQIKAALELGRRATSSEETLESAETAFDFSSANVSEGISAILQASDTLAEPSERRVRRIRHVFVKDQVFKSIEALQSNEANDGNDWVGSAIDLVMQRERLFAKNEDREPQLWSGIMHDEAQAELNTPVDPEL